MISQFSKPPLDTANIFPKILSNSSYANNRENQSPNPQNFYLWWAVKIFGVADAGVNFKSTVNACRDWSKNGNPGKFDCVWGSISTALALASIVDGVYLGYLAVGTYLAQNRNAMPHIAKRDYGIVSYSINDLNEHLSNATGLEFATLHYENGTLLLNDQTSLPIHAVRNPYGGIHHMSFMGLKDNRTTLRIATSQEIISAKRDEQFNLENFSQGGIESEFYSVGASKAHLSADNDFGQLDHEVSCGVDLNQHAFQYEIWDYNHNEAMTVGWVSAFQYDSYDDMLVVPYPDSSAPDMGNCYVN